jgi:hypothetical protein
LRRIEITSITVQPAIESREEAVRLWANASSPNTRLGIEVNANVVNGPGKVHTIHERGRSRFQLLILVRCIHVISFVPALLPSCWSGRDMALFVNRQFSSLW